MPWPFKTKVAAARLAVKYQSAFLGMGAARWLTVSYQKLATEGFENNPIVYACITKLAKSVSSVDLELYSKGKDGKLKQIDAHPILDLLNRPNPLLSGRKFLEKLATQYLIGGNAYVLGADADPLAAKVKPPRQLWLLPPQYTKLKASAGSLMPQYYEYKPGGGDGTLYPVNQITGRSQVLHLKTVNPLYEDYGLPPLAAAAYGVDIFNAGQAWNKALLQNEGRPSGALQMRAGANGVVPNLSDEQFERLKQEIGESFTGAANAGRPLLLDSALEWVSMSMTAKDMDHQQNMLTNARFIAACFGTPPQLVNIPGESTYSNYEQATLGYWADTVLPLLGTLLEDLNGWLQDLFGEDVFLWYNEEQIPALEPRRKELFDRLNGASFLEINEKREAAGKEAVDGGDAIFVPATDIPLELAGIVDPRMHPVLAGDTPAQESEAESEGAPTGAETQAKFRQRLEGWGYSKARAEHLAALAYGK